MRTSNSRFTGLALVALFVASLAACTDTKTEYVVSQEIPACSAAYPSGACESGQTCFQGACTSTADLCSPSNRTGTCPSGFACYAGGCVLGGEVPADPAACGPTVPNGACNTDQTCFMGACVVTASICSASNQSGVCPAGWACYGGGCILASAVPPVIKIEEVDCAENVYATQPTIGLRTALSRASGTATLAAVVAGNTLAIGGTTFTAVAASPTNVQFAVGADDAATTTNLVAAVNANTTTNALVSAAAQGAVVTFTAVTNGVNGNNVALSGTATRFALSGTSLLGGGGSGKTAITADGLQFRDASGDGTLQPYEDWRKHPICRAQDLVSRMNFEQKIGLLMEAGALGNGPADSIPTVNAKTALTVWHVRQGLNRSGSGAATVTNIANWTNSLQEICEAQPLGIPTVITDDPQHGATSTKWTPWPGPLGLGAINDATITKQYGDVVRKEFMATGTRWQLGPMADTSTEPRWSRVSGTYGENALAVAKHTAACIRGFQGSDTGDLHDGIAATMKHFPGHGPELNGFDAHGVDGKFSVFPGSNFDYHLMPFQAAIDVGVAAVMPNYTIQQSLTDINPLQVPSAFAKGVVTDLLKTEMGFSGMVTGDWETLTLRPYGMESLTLAERAALWFEAGSHQFGLENSPAGTPGAGFIAPGIKEAYANGWVTDAQIDGAATKVLEMTFKLGVFENPYVDATQTATIVRSAEHRTQGFEAMKKAIVILRRTAAYLPISGAAAQDVNADGVVSVFFDGNQTDALAGTDYMSDLLETYDYTAPAGTGTLAVTQAASLATADIAVIRIGGASGTDPATGLISLSYDRNTNNRNKVIDALRVRGGYVDSTGAAVPAANPTLRIVLVTNLGIASILKPWVNGLVSLDQTPGVAGSYPSVGPANIKTTASGAVDALLVDFGAVDRAVLDVVFNKNIPTDWTYGKARLPFEIPSSDEAVAAQFEDLPGDSWQPTYQIGAGVSY